MSGVRIAQIQNIIKEFKDIFDSSVIEATKFNSRIKTINDVLYLPYIPLNTTDGLKLADEVGFITIREENVGNSIFYNYRFFTNEYEYLFINKKNKTKDYCKDAFYFHFDKGDLSHLTPHVSVIMPDIRYPSKEIDLKMFLNFIRNTFFIPKNGKYVRKIGNIWDNNFI